MADLGGYEGVRQAPLPGLPDLPIGRPIRRSGGGLYPTVYSTRGTPADLETLRGRSGRPVCLHGHVSLPVVFLPVRGDPWYRCAGMQQALGLTQICVSPSEPSRTDPVQGQGGRGASPLGGALLAQSDVVSRTDAPRDSPSLANSSEEGSTFSERGHPLAPGPDLWNIHVWSLDGTRGF